MALIDDYRATFENDHQFRQRVTVQLPRTLVSILGGTPTIGQLDYGRQYAASPEGTVAQALPFVAAFILNGGTPDLADDAQIISGVEQAIARLVALGVGITAASP